MGLQKIHNAVGVGTLLGRTWLVVCCATIFTACSITAEPSSEELALLKNPPSKVKQKQDTLTPLTLEWYKQIESQYLAKGRELTEEEIKIAREVGVAQPEHVRVIILNDFPLPANKTLYNHTKQYGLGTTAESGRTMGNIVMLKARVQDQRWMLAHQLSYIAQQQRMGRREYIRRFIAEREIMGNKRAPMVLKANKVAMDFK